MHLRGDVRETEDTNHTSQVHKGEGKKGWGDGEMERWREEGGGRRREKEK